MPSEQAIALFTNVFGYAPDPEALHAGECWQAERIDAALRRARVEGMREAITIITRAVTWTPQSVLEILERLARIAELERAAQIEEGEHDDSHTSND